MFISVVRACTCSSTALQCIAHAFPFGVRVGAPTCVRSVQHAYDRDASRFDLREVHPRLAPRNFCSNKIYPAPPVTRGGIYERLLLNAAFIALWLFEPGRSLYLCRVHIFVNGTKPPSEA